MLPAPDFPARECPCAVVAEHSRGPPAPALLSSHRQSTDLGSLKWNLPRGEIQAFVLLLPTLQPLPMQLFRTRVLQTGTDRSLSCRRELNPAPAPTSLSYRRRQE